MDIRPIEPHEAGALTRLLVRSFHLPVAVWEAWYAQVGLENVRVAVGPGGLVGGLGFYRSAQWFGGRPVGSGLVASVAVAPEARGAGVGAALMRTALEEMRAAGLPLSALYPASRPVYRKVGYESAGLRLAYRMPLHRLAPLPADGLEVRVARREELGPVYDRFARRQSGMLQRTPGLWDRLLEGGPLLYAVADEAYAVVEAGERTLRVRDVAWTAPAAGARLWALLAAHRSVIDTVEWVGPAVDPWALLARDADPQVAFRGEWMTRVVDVPGALEARGYPGCLTTDLHLEVQDALLPANAGRWVLHLEGGRGRVEPGGRGDVTLDVGALAPLYTGHLGAGDLAAAGRLRGPIEAVAAAFAGPGPWMPDAF